MSNVEATLAALERPPRRGWRVRGLSLRDRLELSPAAGRLVPRELALQRAARSGERQWEDSELLRRKAAKWMKDVLGRPRSADVEPLAREAVIDWNVRQAMLARPWEGAGGQVYGLEDVARARAGGRGVILMGAHLGLVFHGALVVARHCQPYYVVRAAREDADRGRGAQVRKHRMRALERAGNRWVDRRGSYPVLRRLLERGDMVGMVFDAAGRMETELAGHRTWVAGGWAALAFDVGIAVVLSFTLRDGSEQVTWFEEPIEPGDFADPAEFHRHTGARVGRWMLDNPVQLYPRRFPTRPRPE
jgi:lauroyl/myristoyl acyltransferase